METKIKKRINIITLIVLTVGLIHSIIGLIGELSIGQNILLSFAQFVFLIPYALAAAIIFGAGRLISAKTQNKDKTNDKDKEIFNSNKLKKIADVITLIILIAGFGICLVYYIGHAITCTGCSSHGAHPQIELMIYGVIILFAAVVFAISRLMVRLLKINDKENGNTKSETC